MPIKGVKNHIAKTQILPPHPHVIFFAKNYQEWYGYSLKDRYFVYTQKQI